MTASAPAVSYRDALYLVLDEDGDWLCVAPVGRWCVDVSRAEWVLRGDVVMLGASEEGKGR